MDTVLTSRQSATDRCARTATRIDASRRLAAETRWQIIASYQRLVRRPPIAGASDDDDGARRESIRARLASGALPLLEGSAWAGVALGDHRCACCHETIRAREIEYEPRDQKTLHAHVRCFAVWLAESRLAGGPASLNRAG